ncbi:MAG: SMC-Scp complex subunit ScpB [Bacteroidota bacterium]
MDLRNVIEAIVFVSDQPVTVDFIIQVLKKTQEESAEDLAPEREASYSKEQIRSLLNELVDKYQSDIYPFEVKAVAEGYQFFTKRAFYPYVKQATLQKNKKRLSKSALETLAIIAYKQPITKAEAEFIRGVSCDYAIQKLLERKLVSITGRSDAPGRPLLYATSPFFMQYFGIKDVSDLPKLKEFEELAEDHLEMFRQQQEEQTPNGSEEAEEITQQSNGEGPQSAE